MNEKQQLEQDIQKWLTRVDRRFNRIVDEGNAILERVVNLTLPCVFDPETSKRFTPNNPPEGSTLAVGDVISWSDNGTLSNPNDTVDVYINGIDQGLSTASGQYTLTNVPAGPIQVCFIEILRNDANEVIGTGEECCYQYIGAAVSENIEKQYDIPDQPVGQVSDALWEQMTGGAWSWTGTGAGTSIVVAGGEGWIQTEHLEDELTVENGVCLLERKEGNDSYKVSQCIEFAPNFDHGGTNTINNSGKLGFGLAGGRNANGGIVSGGDTSPLGWSVRPGFDVFGGANGTLNFIAYCYYRNRPGMNWPGAPPTTGQVFGEQKDTGVQIVPGNKYIYEMQVIHNTPGVADGSLVISISDANGNYLGGFTKTNMILMDGVPYTDLNTYGSWHGGSIEFAAPQDTYVRYKDIVVSCIPG